ncbi:hypothetical protein UACE39S_00673 [Ureibacillus acetophenoni]
MKRITLLTMALLNFISPINSEATTPEHEVIATNKDEDIMIFAKKTDGFYEDFQIDYKGIVFHRPSWKNVTNPTYAPQIVYEDINSDNKKELIIILTTGYGTGVLEEVVAVFHQNKDQSLKEVLVDNPLAIVNKNVKSSLNSEKAEIRIGKNHYEVNVARFSSYPERLFDEIFFGSIIQYEVMDKNLTVTLYPLVAPGVFIGSIIITYQYRDNMYQAKSIEFQPE